MTAARRPDADGARSRPAPSQELLLDACLADEDAALAAWRRWCATTDLDAIDEESFRHLPLAWYRLQRSAPRDRTYDIAKGIYRQAWYRNQLLLRTAGGVLDAFADESIEAMPLKGTSLAARCYPTPATARPRTRSSRAFPSATSLVMLPPWRR